MFQPAIRVQGLSKRYHIGASQQRHKTFRDALSGLMLNPLQRFKSLAGRVNPDEIFWALQEVSLDVKPGEVVGIIGRNGAGKSTLLKILSRITEPTSGRVEINGRIASLLEVGTGFHPELTGRENVFLNGAILGMSRGEIRRKFDEIVEFSGVEKFIDTPVKRYSSGMTVRLAFSVAAHLEPEILIVDEVLAVGDAAFQERCLKKMDNVASGGRTVVFVSHQMQAVANLCHMAMELQNGRTANWGPAREVVNRYLSAETANSSSCTWTAETAPGDDIIRLLGVRVEDQHEQSPAVYGSDQPIRILIDFDCAQTPSSLQVGFDLFLPDGTHVLRACQTDIHQPSFTIGLGRNRLCCEIPSGLLNGCSYFVAPWASLHNIKWCYKERPVVQFQVSLAHGESAFWHGLTGVARGGVISPIFKWNSA